MPAPMISTSVSIGMVYGIDRYVARGKRTAKDTLTGIAATTIVSLCFRGRWRSMGLRLWKEETTLNLPWRTTVGRYGSRQGRESVRPGIPMSRDSRRHSNGMASSATPTPTKHVRQQGRHRAASGGRRGVDQCRPKLRANRLCTAGAGGGCFRQNSIAIPRQMGSEEASGACHQGPQMSVRLSLSSGLH